MKMTSLLRAIHVMIMGAPGSGKGTVSSRIVRDFAIEHVPCGDILRAEIANNTAYGKIATQFIKDGQLVPDEVVVELMLSQIQRIPVSKSWLLDGFPRNTAQANRLFENEKLDAVINLDVPFPVIKERLSGRWTHIPSGRVYNEAFNPPHVAGIDDVTGEPLVQRDDDKPETVLKRLDTYQKQTEPLLNLFRKKNILHNYTGTRTNDLWPHIKQFIKGLVTSELKRADL